MFNSIPPHGAQTPSPPAKALKVELAELEGENGLGSPTAGGGEEPMETEHPGSKTPAGDESIDDYIEPRTPLGEMEKVDGCGDAATDFPVLYKDFLAPEGDEHVPGFVLKLTVDFDFLKLIYGIYRIETTRLIA